MKPLPPCPRCGGNQYRDDDGVSCLMCGALTWEAPPVPWTPPARLPRLPVGSGAFDE